jgi:dGTPase
VENGAKPSVTIARREERYHQPSKSNDQRNDFEIDRDRLIYSFAFRRLAQVTQVASANEGNVFHNRLTHSLKVAQVGKRLAEYLLTKTPDRLIQKCGGLVPDVVETACLAHDLGHPPFGHVAEKELDLIAREFGLSDGFEGNAQTFRILTKLEPYKPNYAGINLTRATLDATLKYPWCRDRDRAGNLKNTKEAQKFSIYDLDKDIFEFVRPDAEYRTSRKQSLEASVMEFADDITYSVHDLEDFYLAGLIPLNILVQNQDEWHIFFQDWLNHIRDNELKEKVQNSSEQDRLKNFLSSLLPPRYAPGSIEQITNVRNRSSFLIQRYIQSACISENYGRHGHLDRKVDEEIELKLLQRIVWKYVIKNPRLVTRQYGQVKIIRALFEIYKKAIDEDLTKLIPAYFLKDDTLINFAEKSDRSLEKIRLAVDIVASLSESEAVLMYRRLTGLEQGSIMDYLG